MTFWTVRTEGADIAVFEYGNRKAESTVLLVHGYPDDHHVFDSLIAELGDSARIIAYDTRGGGLTSVDDHPRNYAIERLADDAYSVVASIPQLDGRVHVFAHDWGSLQMWEAMASPLAAETFASYTSVSGPSLDHLRQVSRARLSSPRRWSSAAAQLTRSWYVGAFYVPILRRWVPRLLASYSGDDAPTPTAADQQRGIALYRANIMRRMRFGPAPHCDVPTTVVVPTRDRYLSPNLTDGLDRWVPHLSIVKVDAGHWWPHTHPKDAAALLLSQL